MFKRNWKIISLALLGAVFFVVYLYLYLPSAPKYPNYLILNQPDESVNYFFIRELALNNRFGLPESLTAITASQVHPRSTTVVNGAIVPIGFPGVIMIFGLIIKFLVKIFGVSNFNLLAATLTPFLAAVTPLFFYGFLRRVWDERAAWLSSALLFFLPPWWYYASRPFQHNTLLVFLVVAGLYFYMHGFASTSKILESCHSERQRGILSLIFERFLASLRFLPHAPCLPAGRCRQAGAGRHGVRNDKFVAIFLSGLFFGLAIYVRPSEIVWLTALGIYGLVMARKAWNWREYFSCGVGLVLTAILFFATQTAFYGSALASGYVRPTIDGAGGIITAGPQGISLIKAVFLPFGLHFGAIARNFYEYFFKLFGVWSLLALAGAFLLIKFKKNFYYLLIYIIGSIYLLIFYGSWQFFDNLLQVPSIGTSYVRYFLLIYVFGLPFLSFFLLWLWQKKHIFKIVTVILFMALVVNSLGAVFAPLEGLSAVKTTVARYGEWQEKIYSLTEDNAVIITRYADKYLFPVRKIIPGWEMTEQKNAIILLAQKGTPIYLYDLKLTEKEDAEWREFLVDKNLKLSPPLAGWENLELRKIDNYVKLK